MPRNYKNLDKEKIAELFDQNLSNAEIAREFGVKPATIRAHRAKMGYPPSKHKNGASKNFSRDLFLDLHNSGMSARRISEHMGCSMETVSRIRKELGVAQRPTGQGLAPLDVRLGKAESLLDEGYSFAHIEKLLHISDRTLAKYFPGRQWTREQVSQYGGLTQNANKLYKKLGV